MDIAQSGVRRLHRQRHTPYRGVSGLVSLHRVVSVRAITTTLLFACGLLLTLPSMAQTGMPTDVASTGLPVASDPSLNRHYILEAGAPPPESLPPQIRRVTATGVIQRADDTRTLADASITSPTPSVTTASSISATTTAESISAPTAAITPTHSAQAPVPPTAPPPIAVAPVPANSTLNTVMQSVTSVRKVGHSGFVIVPVAFNDDGATLTRPDLSGYREQRAELEQIQSDQWALQQLELWQAQQAAVTQTHGGKMASLHTATSKPAATMHPYLIDLTGVGDDLQARIMVPGYGPTTVRAGQILPNHWQIDAIDDDGVTYRTGPGRSPQRIVYQSQDAEAMAELPLSDLHKDEGTRDVKQVSGNVASSVGPTGSNRVSVHTGHPSVSRDTIPRAPQSMTYAIPTPAAKQVKTPHSGQAA